MEEPVREIVGLALSMLMPLTVVELLLSALSVAVPVADLPMPSVDIVTSGVKEARPERESDAVK